MILSSFYMGYAIAHFPGGLIADWIGGKAVIVTALLTTVAITLSIPTVVSFGGAYGLIVLRITMGLLQGGIFPAVNTILSAWVPQNERSRMASLIFCGYPVSYRGGHLIGGSRIRICLPFSCSSAQPLPISARALFCITTPIGMWSSTTSPSLASFRRLYL